MVKHTQTIRWQQPTNSLCVSDHFVVLVLKEIKQTKKKKKVQIVINRFTSKKQRWINVFCKIFSE